MLEDIIVRIWVAPMSTVQWNLLRLVDVKIIQSFQGSNFVQFGIVTFIIYVNSNTSDVIFSIKFRLFEENLVTSFI